MFKRFYEQFCLFASDCGPCIIVLLLSLSLHTIILTVFKATEGKHIGKHCVLLLDMMNTIQDLFLLLKRVSYNNPLNSEREKQS